jgi:hypothetical protein
MKYKTVKITDRIIAVVVPDDYDRAMLFCKVQEFYESPNPRFRQSKFSIWDYQRWYARNHSGCFSYTKDFVGFNLPLVVVKKCLEVNGLETPYDEVMSKIAERFFKSGERTYLIGVDSLKDSTFDHELCHALYYVDDEYRIKMDELTATIGKSSIVRFKENLKSMGYCKGVLKDEIQAYMATEINKKMTKGVRDKRQLHRKYKSLFKKLRPIVA